MDLISIPIQISPCAPCTNSGCQTHECPVDRDSNVDPDQDYKFSICVSSCALGGEISKRKVQCIVHVDPDLYVVPHPNCLFHVALYRIEVFCLSPILILILVRIFS